MNKSKLTPLTKGGTRTVHAGKGSRQGPMNARAAITAPGQAPPTINNYAKAAPTTPAPAPPPGLGSGVFPGVGSP